MHVMMPLAVSWLFEAGCCGCCGFIVLFFAVLAVVIALRPGTFRLERAVVINAPAERIFPLINDFHQWTLWSPWEKMDPNLKRSYSGAESGVGSIYQWVGNKKVGEGRMTIVETRPPEWASIKLEFLKPWRATNTATFKLTPEGTGTRVVWAMEGTQSFMMKAFSLFMNMEKMVGPDFERGLSNLRAAAETGQSA
jgi:uncharacterized protein YndB with AHSA1/START domain